MKKIIFTTTPLRFILILSALLGISSMSQASVLFSSFSAPTGIAFNTSGDMYVTNWSGNAIIKISKSGQRETIHADIASPAGIVIDAKNNIYVSSYSGDYILHVDAEGVTKKISDGYQTPTGIALSNSGRLLITNRSSGEIVSLNLSSGEKQVIVTGLSLPVGVTELQNGSLVVSQYSGRLTLIYPNGQKKEIGAGFDRPGVGIITESNDTVVVIDNGAGAIRRVNVITGKTEMINDQLPSAVALASYKENYYVGTWSDGSVHIIDK